MTEDIWVLVVLLVVFIGGYFLLMFFYPEWVGISGRRAKATNRKLRGDSPDEPDDSPADKAPTNKTNT